MGHYIPVAWLTFGLDYTLWGMNPLGYHLTNNLIHSVNTALFYLVALRMLAKATSLTGTALRSGSAAAALFFALHPLRAESVAWATERRDVLAGLFFLLTVLMYLRAAEAEGAHRRRLLAGSLACYVLALLSKSIVMTLPLALFLLDVYPLRRLSIRWGMWRDASTRRVLAEKLPYLALGLAGAATSYWAVASNHYLTDMRKFGWPGRIAIAMYSLWFYLEKTVLPLSLSPLYELPATVNPLEPRFLYAGVAVMSRQRSRPRAQSLVAGRARRLGLLRDHPRPGERPGARRTSARPRSLQLHLLSRRGRCSFGAAFGGIAQASQTGAVRPAFIRSAAVAAAVWILALGHAHVESGPGLA